MHIATQIVFSPTALGWSENNAPFNKSLVGEVTVSHEDGEARANMDGNHRSILSTEIPQDLLEFCCWFQGG